MKIKRISTTIRFCTQSPFSWQHCSSTETCLKQFKLVLAMAIMLFYDPAQYNLSPNTKKNGKHVRLKEEFPTPVTPFEGIKGHCMHLLCNGNSHGMVKL